MTRPLCAAVVLVLALLAVRELRRNAHAVAVADQAEARADTAFTYAMWAQHALVEELRTRDAEILRFGQERDSALARADSLAQRRPTLVTRIVEVAGDSAQVVEAVEALEAEHEQETDALRAALAAADSISESRRLQLVEALYVNGQLQTALEASRTEARLWEKAAKSHISPALAFGGGAVATAAVVVWWVLK